MVLFPGIAAPLHLFEPRYRQMLADVRSGDQRFGMLCSLPDTPERELPPGRVGCVAEVTHVDMLADGRSNIVVVGRERFSLTAFVAHDAPYHVAQVESFEDALEPSSPVALTLLAGEVAASFQRVAKAVHTLNGDDTSAPTVSDDPRTLAWTIASMIDLPLDVQQALLSDRSPGSRLTTVDRVLRRVLPDLELRAALKHERP